MIRHAVLSDAERITAIYNHEILNGIATFDTEIKSPEERLHWLEAHESAGLPVLVFEQNERVIGFASLNRWSTRKAYDITAEVSVYVDASYRGRGAGAALLIAILIAGKEAGIHSLISRTTEGNSQSISMQIKEGFSHVGVMVEAGQKFGRYLSVTLMQKML